MTLFSAEIQKGIPYATIFVHRVSLVARYTREYLHNNGPYEFLRTYDCFWDIAAMQVVDTITLQLIPMLGINTGAFTYAILNVNFNFMLYFTGGKLSHDLGITWAIRF
jgi:hypothetical protein